tara:strand:- start:192 stop:488 length:297 start_codon:yes stop_codon:yes gene_type:complete
MAIKERKIPSPSEIKSTPQAFSKEELDKLISLRNEHDKITFQLGQLYISKIQLEKDENLLKNKLSSTLEKEKTIAEDLSKKYGNGTIDLESGTFIPSK